MSDKTQIKLEGIIEFSFTGGKSAKEEELRETTQISNPNKDIPKIHFLGSWHYAGLQTRSEIRYTYDRPTKKDMSPPSCPEPETPREIKSEVKPEEATGAGPQDGGVENSEVKLEIKQEETKSGTTISNGIGHGIPESKMNLTKQESTSILETTETSIVTGSDAIKFESSTKDSSSMDICEEALDSTNVGGSSERNDPLESRENARETPTTTTTETHAEPEAPVVEDAIESISESGASPAADNAGSTQGAIPTKAESCGELSGKEFPAGRWSGSFDVKAKTGTTVVQETFQIWKEDEKDEGETVKVEGHGVNQYGQFNLNGTYNSTTRALNLTRIYYKLVTAPRRSYGGGRKKATPPVDDGPPLYHEPTVTERRARRTRPTTPSSQDPPTPRSGDEMDDSSPTSLQPAPSFEGKTFGNGRRSRQDSAVSSSGALKRQRSGSSSMQQDCMGGSKLAALLGIGDNVSSDSTAQAVANLDREQSSVRTGIPAEFVPPPAVSSSASRTPSGDRQRTKSDQSSQSWRPAYVDDEAGQVYEGGWEKGERTGHGTCVYSNGHMYEGNWRRGKEHGQGHLMTGDRKTIYKGDWVDGKLCGKGTYVFPDEGTYIGDWRDNMRNGRGVYSLPNGSRYEGDWRDNCRNGRGILTWDDGSMYDGEWQEDVRHGRGVLHLKSGFQYDGQWVNDEMEGRGTCTHEDGQKYEGMFQGGLKSGRGTLLFPNGALYEGRFRNDKIDGQGMLRMPNPVPDSKDGDWMLPISSINDMERIHVKAGFDKGGK